MQSNDLVQNISERIIKYRPNVYENNLTIQYASVSIILRQLANKPPEILYLLRAKRESDPWSGHVAFPGGKREESDHMDSKITAIRETLEEIGVDLNSDTFQYLGRLDDLRIGFGQKMVVSPHVFMQLTDREEPYKISESEVQSVRYISIPWISQQLALFSQYGTKLRDDSESKNGAHGKEVAMNMSRLIPVLKKLPPWIINSNAMTAKFPNICLHEHNNLSTKLAHELDEDYVLWGLTLKMTVHLFDVAGIFEFYTPHDVMIHRYGLKNRLNGYNENWFVNLFMRSSSSSWYEGGSMLILKRIAKTATIGVLTLLAIVIAQIMFKVITPSAL
jgi:8-oxo-dGTP pyrophosphatase MutT (NUDIX family)